MMGPSTTGGAGQNCTMLKVAAIAAETERSCILKVLIVKVSFEVK